MGGPVRHPLHRHQSSPLLDPLEVRLAQFILLNASNHLFTLQLADRADALKRVASRELLI